MPDWVFHGKLEAFFAAGLGIVMVSEIVAVLITSLFSSDHATLVVPQSPTAVIQGIVAGSVIAAAPADISQEALFAVVFLIIALSAVLTGGFLLLLGLMRAGGLVRYIPYPIVGGFMAGLGWLIVNAGFSTLVGLRLNAQSLPARFLKAPYSRAGCRLSPSLCASLGCGLASRAR